MIAASEDDNVVVPTGVDVGVVVVVPIVVVVACTPLCGVVEGCIDDGAIDGFDGDDELVVVVVVVCEPDFTCEG